MNNKEFTKNKNTNDELSITVSNETAKKISLFGAITIIIGVIVGSGVFFKNISVFKENHGNPWGVVLSWIIVTIIALSTAYTYGEITRAKNKNPNSGLAGWAERYVGYNFGRFLNLMYSLFLYPIYVVATSIFTAEALLNINPAWIDDGISTNFWYVILISCLFIALFTCLNIVSRTFSSKLSKYTTIIKFIPALMVIICGIVAGILNPEHNLFIHPENYKPYNEDPDPKAGQFDIFGVLNSLPGILFAFDSFLVIGNVAKDIKNPTKNIPLSIILSMSVSGILYIFITIGFCLSGESQPYKLIALLAGDNNALKTSMNCIISILLFVCIFGVFNSFLIGNAGSMEAAIEENNVIGSRWIKKICNGKKDHYKQWIMGSIVISIYICIISIPSGIIQCDQLYDGCTSVIPTFSFMIFAFVAIMCIVNRKTQRVPQSEVSYQKFQTTATVVSAIGCFGINLYGMIYQFLIYPILYSDQNSTWGLFFKNVTTLKYYQSAIVFWIAAALFFSIPFINDLFIKWKYKDYDKKLLWQ